MLRLVADENFNNNLVRGLLRRLPALDIVRIRDVGLSGADDPTVLEWAAGERRVLLTHDVTTITRYAYDRIKAGLPMSGVLEVALEGSTGAILDDLELIVAVGVEGEWDNMIGYVPLK